MSTDFFFYSSNEILGQFLALSRGSKLWIVLGCLERGLILYDRIWPKATSIEKGWGTGYHGSLSKWSIAALATFLIKRGSNLPFMCLGSSWTFAHYFNPCCCPTQTVPTFSSSWTLSLFMRLWDLNDQLALPRFETFKQWRRVSPVLTESPLQGCNACPMPSYLL